MRPIDRLILALDVPTGDEALRWAERLAPRVGLIKIGLRLFVAEGPRLVRAIRDRGAAIFLDLKLHDIPSTVEAAMRAAASLDVQLATIHASGGPTMIAAAAEGAAGRTTVLAVTVLTSIAESEAASVFGADRAIGERVTDWAAMAMESGADGVVCSPLEAARVKAAAGSTRRGVAPLIVTPGVRASGGVHGDQSRTLGAREAVKAGATHLVVGRPILDAPSPEEAADRLVAEIAAGIADATRGTGTGS